MSLVRFTGLIALAVATTLQASARPAPSHKANEPARQEAPDRGSVPDQKVSRNNQKRELILVIAPQASAWSDAEQPNPLDGSGPAPGAEQNPVADSAVDRPLEAGRATDTAVSGLSIRPTRTWLAAHYAHAPPAGL